VQRLGVTPATTDPVIATIFATEAENYGRGVVYIAGASDLAGAPIRRGNVLASLEAEVGVGIPPLEFARRARLVISAADARAILATFAIRVRPMIRGAASVDTALQELPRLDQARVTDFVQLASTMGKRP
jgi:hypothetical protein